MKAAAEGESPRQWATMVRTSSLDDFRRLRQSNPEAPEPVPANQGIRQIPLTKYLSSFIRCLKTLNLRGEDSERKCFRSDSTQTQFLCDESMEEDLHVMERSPSIAKLPRMEGLCKDAPRKARATQTTFNIPWTRPVPNTGTVGVSSTLYNHPLKYENWPCGLGSNRDCLEHSLSKESMNRQLCEPLFSANEAPPLPLSFPSIVSQDLRNHSLFSVVDQAAQQGRHSALSLWPIMNESPPILPTLQASASDKRNMDQMLGVPVKRGFDGGNQLTPVLGSFNSVREESIQKQGLNPLQFQWSGRLAPTQFDEAQIFAKQNLQNMYLTASTSCPAPIGRAFPAAVSHQTKQSTVQAANSRTGPSTQKKPRNGRLSPIGGRPPHGHDSTLSLARGTSASVKQEKAQGTPVTKLTTRLKNTPTSTPAPSPKRERARTREPNRRQTTSKRRTLVSSSSQDSETASNGQSTLGNSTPRYSRIESRGRSTFADMVRANVIKTGPQIWTVGHDANIHVVVKANGAIVYKDSEFNSISSFALAVIRERNPSRLACDGWKDVKYEGKRLDSLRESYLYRTSP